MDDMTELDIRIVRATKDMADLVDGLRTSFVVRARVKVSVCGDSYDFDVDSVEHPYEKTEPQCHDCTCLGRDDAAIFLAYAEDDLVGRVCVQEDRNRMARIWGLRVEHGPRHHGIATALINTARQWSAARDLHWLRAETQDIHVTTCMFYRDYGFTVGSFDRFYLQAVSGSEDETTIVWYLKI